MQQKERIDKELNELYKNEFQKQTKIQFGNSRMNKVLSSKNINKIDKVNS